VRASTRKVVAYEALARGTAGGGFMEVFKNVTEENLYRFDQACRVKAIRKAEELGMTVTLNINFTPNAVYKPELRILTCSLLNIGVLAEGVERAEEYRWLRDQGIDLFQGYYFARPGFEHLPEVDP
jgi:EAL domain-containing protein (putative c-di-GMP-specific phosphodiesterase class I)